MNLFNELKQKLGDTGLSENEIGVYISLLKIGESTTGKILNDYKMSSGKIYIVLDKLIKKGLVSYAIKNNVKHFKAHNPMNILEYLKKEKEEIEKKANSIQNMIPDLQNMLNSDSDEVQVEVYEGIDGFKTAVYKVLEEHEIGGKEWEFDHFEFGKDEDMPDSIRYVMRNYSKGMMKKNISVKLLVSTDNKKAINDVKKVLEGTNFEFRHIENQKFASIFFTKDKTLIIDYVKPHVVFIRNKAIAQGFIRMFEAMWMIGKKV